MEDCSKTRAGAVAALPDDLLVEIISRVPAMYVCRFKCVSKAWRDLIAHPDHRKKLSQGQAMQGVFFMTLEKGHFSFSLMDLTARSMPLDVDPAFSFVTELPGNHNLKLLDSCNGLLLFGHQSEPPYYEEASGYIVCNPTTKQWEAVPYCGSRREVNHAYLAFDPAVSSYFHLVQFQETGMYDLKLTSVRAHSSETETWSHHDQTKDEKEQGQSEGWWNHVHLSMNNRCAIVNGFVLHLIIWARGSNKQQIVVVDVQGRARRMIRLPDVVTANWSRCKHIYFGQSQGYLHCITKELSNNFHEKRYRLSIYSIWVLQDYDAQEWVLKDTVSSLQLFGEKRHKHVLLDSEVADMHLDCNVVLFFSTCEHKFIAYDMDHKKVSVFGTSKRICRLKVGHYVPCFQESPAPLKQGLTVRPLSNEQLASNLV